MAIHLVPRPSTSRPRAAGTAVVVALAVALGVGGALVSPTPAKAWTSGTFSADSEAQLVVLHNQARSAAGLLSLKLDPILTKAARWRAKDMADRGYFGHTILGTDREVFWYLQYTYRYCFKVAGENLGELSWDGASVSDVTNWTFSAWMGSKGHRSNILGSSWDSIGVGAYRGADGRYTWTVLFADSCGPAGAAPKPTPNPTPKPTPKPTPRPTAKPTQRPSATHPPTPGPTPGGNGDAAAPPPGVPSTSDAPASTQNEVAGQSSAPWTGDNSVSPTPLPSGQPMASAPTPVGWANPGSTLRVVDDPGQRSLLDVIVNAVLGPLFGS